VDGELHTFEFAGLFNGISLLRDYETRSLWHHISGKALYGDMLGAQLQIFNVLQMTVDQALEWNPDLEVAISDRPIRRRDRWEPLKAMVRGLSERFLGTMSPRDERRDDMEIGAGTWTDGDAQFFPMTRVEEEGGFAFSELDGRAVLVFIDPLSRTLFAQYTEATSAAWDDDVLRLNNGRHVQSAALYEGDERLKTERPMQVFTRWYGFALSFPGTRVYGDGG
jgi:Protein of unknown function (DUF3179)